MSNNEFDFKYKIPSDIKARFTDEFYENMFDALCSTFGIVIEEYNWHYDYPIMNEFTGTTGWSEAFNLACEIFAGLDDILAYYNDLSWTESDLFDAEIAQEVEKRFVRKTNGVIIRQKSDEELAAFLADIAVCCDYMNVRNTVGDGESYGDLYRACKERWLEFLKRDGGEDAAGSDAAPIS